MTTNSRHQEAVALEALVNEAYLKWLDRQAGERTVLPGEPLNGSMSLVGRVEFAQYDSDIEGRDLHIGSLKRFEEGSSAVICWAARGAAVFFGKADPTTVRVRRSMTVHGTRIVNVEDDWLVEQDAEAFSTSSVQKLRLPKTLPPRSPREPTDVQVAETDAPTPVAPPKPAPPRRGKRKAARTVHESQDVGSMRAAGAVLAALGAPRAQHLTSVLATLQPDQYELVIQPPQVPLAVQGHPGTGKTIVAAHRAAFLVNPAREGEQLKNILLIGPTLNYVQHVKHLVRELDTEKRVTTESLDAILARVAGLQTVPPPAERDPDIDDISTETGQLIRDVAHRARAAGLLSRQANQAREQVWEMIRKNRIGDQAITNRFDLQVWADRLPAYSTAVRQRRLLPLLAIVALELTPLRDSARYAHVVVDEAQDVTPLEWMVIRELNAGNGWTLVGDMQQRHNDLSHRSWQTLAEEVFEDRNPGSFEPTLLGRGYRSTEAILTYASRLLPVKERSAHGLQVEGAEPSIVEVAKADLGSGAVKLALDLLKQHPEGTAAVIGIDVASVTRTLEDKHGWRQKDSGGPWTHGSSRLSVLTPAMARGLEFDVVVVIEPAAFAKKRGGLKGQLYTSLTRANRELGVVHSEALPRGLKPAKRRVATKKGASRTGR